MTINESDIEIAVRLSLPGELATESIEAGKAAVLKFNESSPAKKDNVDGVTKLNRSVRAGLILPVGRISRCMKDKYGTKRRISALAPVYLAGVLEYLVSEILDLSSASTQNNKLKRITPRHLLLAIHEDAELNLLCRASTIPYGGVVPHIHAKLLPKSKTKAN